MNQIILDMGSGNTSKNDEWYVKTMIDAVAELRFNKFITFKWQLFREAGDNIPLRPEIFDFAYNYAKQLGYKTTASVFDSQSLNFLLRYDVPFIKIANNRQLDWLIGEIPRKIPVYVSVGEWSEYFGQELSRMEDKLLYGNVINANRIDLKTLACVSKYPATIEDYEDNFSLGIYRTCILGNGFISDHTIGLDLYKKYQPKIWEKHFKLPDSTGLDAGDFSITPEELKEIL